ncbi:hypothetical protein Taro_022522, partial [Colocasia esculenta]|nr:hypothetical protein [Colocasia esculenta]
MWSQRSRFSGYRRDRKSREISRDGIPWSGRSDIYQPHPASLIPVRRAKRGLQSSGPALPISLMILKMAGAQTSVSNEMASEMLEQLGNSFIELESNRETSSSYGIMWEEIKEHFQSLDNSLKKRLEELEEKEKAFEEKSSTSQSLIAEREVEVTAKEQASLDRIQELKDAAVAAIAEARKNFVVLFPEPTDVAEDKEGKVSTSINGDPNASVPGREEKSSHTKPGELAETLTADAKPHPQLTHFCEQMDGKGLLKFLCENRKNLAALRGQIPAALKSASDPARLLLDSLEGFYPPEQSTSDGKEKDPALQGLRRTCLVLMESVTPLLGMAEPGGDHPLSSETKQQAKAIADVWENKLSGVGIDAANGDALEAHAFLQLLSTFNLASDFDEDTLCKLVLAVSRRRQAPDLCRSLGLTHKIPGVIESLISSGKHIDAVHFVHAFQLTDSFPPVPLLKAYLTDVQNSQEKSGNDGAAAPQ